MRYIFIVLILISSHFAMAQGIDIDKQLKKIDHLIFTHQLDLAQQNLNSLFQKLHVGKKHQEELQLPIFSLT